jgi:hypothetical protein
MPWNRDARSLCATTRIMSVKPRARLGRGQIGSGRPPYPKLMGEGDGFIA